MFRKKANYNMNTKDWVYGLLTDNKEETIKQFRNMGYYASGVHIEAKVKNVVCLSTDKAAYPINAMGISKAMMEKVIRANARRAAEIGGTTISCTRYGNVMCSRGWI